MTKKFINSRNIRGLIVLLFLVQFGFLVLPHSGYGNPNENANNGLPSQDGKLKLHQSLTDQLTKKEKEVAAKYPKLNTDQRVPPLKQGDKMQLAWTREFYAVTRPIYYKDGFDSRDYRSTYLMEGHCDLEKNYCQEKFKDGYARNYEGGRHEIITVGDFLSTGKDLRVRVYRDYTNPTKGYISTFVRINLEELQNNNNWKTIASNLLLLPRNDYAMVTPVAVNVDNDESDELLLLKHNPRTVNQIEWFRFDIYREWGLIFWKRQYNYWISIPVHSTFSYLFSYSTCANLRTFWGDPHTRYCFDHRLKFYTEAVRFDANGDGRDEVILRALRYYAWEPNYNKWSAQSIILQQEGFGWKQMNYPGKLLNPYIINLDNDPGDEIVWYRPTDGSYIVFDWTGTRFDQKSTTYTINHAICHLL